ncbi:MAG: hypothetical protein NTZ25_03415 [Candidatus Peregrinibacteria bacterium]|nr:hypothetical protein [Candidatus Peregrinibacteria bacterium]
MANFAYYDQLELKINSLITERKFKEAFNVCKESILQYPNESRFPKIKERIEKAVEEENENIIKNKLEEIKAMWKEEKFLEILKTLKNLLAASPNNSKLKGLYTDAEKEYRKQYEKLNEKFNKDQRKRLDSVLKENPNQLTEDLYILTKENPGNQNVKDLVAEYEEKLIAKKIEDKSELINSNKYDVIENFLDELRKINKFSKKIQDVEMELKKRKLEGEIVQTKEFVYGGEKHLDTLVKLKKFDKAMQAAQEILKVDPQNEEAKRVLENSAKEYKDQLKDLAAESINKNFQSLKSEYEQNKTKFIKI